MKLLFWGAVVLVVVLMIVTSSEQQIPIPQEMPRPSGVAAPVPAIVTPSPAVLRVDEIKRRTSEICKGAVPRALRLAKAHANWEPDPVATIACHRFQIGLTADQLRASLGKPERINSTQTATTLREQWVYGDTYIYLEDGVIASYQQSR